MSDDWKPFDIWLLCYDVTIVEAALLTINLEPQRISQKIDNYFEADLPEGYLPARNAIASAVGRNEIVGELNNVIIETPNGPQEIPGDIDCNRSRVDLMELREWLHKLGYRDTFLRLEQAEQTGFRNESHPRYAPKLAAAVEAWEAFDETSTETGTPKQRLARWLRLNASRFGLTDDDGKPSENVIENLAKVANWAVSGGAPKRSLVQIDENSDIAGSDIRNSASTNSDAEQNPDAVDRNLD